ncbi:hypothetical protein UPYG_G00110450 [Umbra pygmaea]|uniref:Uncharacterized protein n=1 Tax=Umbra pygmaea TaxID=75934 RepID=A0ABD0X6J8_UMBPY
MAYRKRNKKKLVSASNRKTCMDLAPWIKSVSNHMWWSCSSSKGDPKELLRRWKSILHHICGVHRWEEGGMEYKCYHTELTADEQRRKRLLAKDSPAYKAFYEAVMNARLLKDLEQMALFKHTGELEVFHNVLLKYCPKRLHFEYASMQARTMLAVMDHNENHNTQREQAKTASGLQRHDVVFQRQSKQWTARPVYKETTQTFRNNMMDAVIQRRLDPSVKYKDPLSHMKVPLLAANIARVSKPNKEDVIAGHTSRFTATD